jgi:hypothetical protein
MLLRFNCLIASASVWIVEEAGAVKFAGYQIIVSLGILLLTFACIVSPTLAPPQPITPLLMLQGKGLSHLLMLQGKVL